MPYQRTSELPSSVKDNLPADKLRQFIAVVNAQLEAGKSEQVAFASAWAAVKKAESVRVGQRVSWSSSGGTARGIVRRIITDGNVPGISGNVKVTGTEDDPAAQIEIIDDEGEPTGTIVGHKIETLRKAQYQGRDVDLNKPFRLPKGSSKKFGVYVNDGDKVKRVTFGDPNMEIRRDDEKARANFRSRHSCDTATDKTSARYWSCRMWEKGTSVSELTKADAEAEMQIEKRQLSDDVFTDAMGARGRAMELGLEGIHVHEMDGQAVYMPGATHQEYLDKVANISGIAPDEQEENTGAMLERAIRAIVSAIVGKTSSQMKSDIVKFDDEQRVVWGWASVISKNGEPIYDTQGDSIEPDVLVKAANEFMMDARVAKAMHDGDQVGEVIHSLPLTKEIGDALGVQSDQEGWIIAMKVHDDDVWSRVKSGELKAFSIGGKAIRNAVEG